MTKSVSQVLEFRQTWEACSLTGHPLSEEPFPNVPCGLPLTQLCSIYQKLMHDYSGKALPLADDSVA